MRRVHAALRDDGFILPFVASYSGLAPNGLLRLAVCATHTTAQIEDLLAALQERS
jgi:hypothetical protein